MSTALMITGDFVGDYESINSDWPKCVINRDRLESD
jgi:hypothetical protein